MEKRFLKRRAAGTIALAICLPRLCMRFAALPVVPRVQVPTERRLGGCHAAVTVMCLPIAPNARARGGALYHAEAGAVVVVAVLVVVVLEVIHGGGEYLQTGTRGCARSTYRYLESASQK